MTQLVGSARLVGNPPQGSPEWHALRLEVIGSSDVSAILGLSPYKSAYTLWHEKAGLIEPVQPDAKTQRKYDYGHHMEPFVAGLFMDAHPELTLSETGQWRHTERDWQGCNPDRLVYDVHGDMPFSLVELKTFPSLADWGDGVPPGYRAQLCWQLDTFGFIRGWLAGYANLSGDYVEHEIEADPFEADAVRAKVRAFADSIADGEAPAIDGSDSTYQTIRKLNPSITPKQEAIIPADVADKYLAAALDMKAATAELNLWKGHLLAHMGTAQYALYSGKKIASRVAVKDGVPYLKEA